MRLEWTKRRPTPTDFVQILKTSNTTLWRTLTTKIFARRFRPAVVKDMIKEILKEQLHDKEYSSEEANVWTKTISDGIKERLKGRKKRRAFIHLLARLPLPDFGYDRYKFVVQVVIGEQRGAGVQ